MPPVVAILVGLGIAVGAGGAVATGIITAAWVFNAIVGIGLSIAFGGIQRAIRGKPNLGSISNDALNRTVTVRQPLSYGRVLYGVGHLGMVLTYLETSGTNNEFLHMVGTLSAHELNSIGTMYFDQVAVPLDGSGNATGTYAGLVHVEKNLGTRDQAAFAGLVAASAGKWTSAHRQRGRAGVYIRLKWDQNKFPNGVPNITFDVTGKKVYDPRAGTIAYSPNSALCLADYLFNASYGLGAQRKYPITAAMLTNSGFSNFNAANLVDGDTATNGWSNNTTNANSTITVDLGSGFDQEFRRCRMFMSLGNQAQTYDIQYSDNASSWTTAAAAFLPNTIGWTEVELAPNGAHRYWRIKALQTISSAGFTNELQFYTSLVDTTQLTDAANTCDEAVSLAAGGTEPRYSTDGAFETSERPADAVTALAGAMAGYCVYVGGKFLLYPGKYRTPDASLNFTEDDLAAPLKVTTRQSKRDIFNSIRGTFVSSVSNWQPTNFPLVTNPTYVAEDGGEIIYLDATLALTTSNARAQRICKIELNRNRRQVTVQARFKFKAYKLAVCDVITFSNTRFGWVNKTFEVKTTQLVSEDDGNGGIGLYVDTVLRETDSNVFDWVAANDELTPSGASSITVFNLRVAQPVTGLTLSHNEVVAPDSSRTLVAVLTWAQPADQYVLNGGRIHVYFKLHTDSGYTQAATLAGDILACAIPGIAPTASYDYKVVTENTAHVFSTDAVLTSQVLSISPSGMLTYRDLSNPLTATDAGSNATINVAAFTMRIQGVGDKSISSGSVTALSYDTLYFVYYDDATMAGGGVTFNATTTKETSLVGAGRFFVGSILTPVAGGDATVGNNDGGATAQAGYLRTAFPTIFNRTAGVVWTNEGNANDRNTGTKATVSLGAGSNNAFELSGFSDPAAHTSYQSLTLKIRTEVVQTVGTVSVVMGYSLTGGTPFTNIYNISGTGRALTTDVIVLPINQDLSKVVVRFSAGAAGIGANGRADFYEAWIEAQG